MFKSQHSSFKGLHKGTQHILYLYKGCCAFYFSWLFVTVVTIIKHFRKPDFFRVCKTLSSDTLIDLASCKICKNHCENYKKHTSRLWPVLFSTTYVFLGFFTYTLLSCVKMKCYCDHCSPQQFRPQTTVQIYIYIYINRLL